MDLTLVVSVVSLGIVGGLCTFGVFYNKYKENLFERIGASFLAVWCFIRIDYRITTGSPTEPVHLFLHIGLAMFFMGLAFSIRKDLAPSSCEIIKRVFHIN